MKGDFDIGGWLKDLIGNGVLREEVVERVVKNVTGPDVSATTKLHEKQLVQIGSQMTAERLEAG